jgi:hypothetical protein
MDISVKIRNGSGERLHQRFQGQANPHTNQFPGAGFSGTRTRLLQCITHEASVEHALGFSAARTRLQLCGCARALGPVRLSQKIPGNSRARRKILGVTGREILGILHHQTTSFAFAGAPITTREEAGSL